MQKGIQSYVSREDKSTIPINPEVEAFFQDGQQMHSMVRTTAAINSKKYISPMGVLKEKFSASRIGRAVIGATSTTSRDNALKRISKDLTALKDRFFSK